MLNNYLITLAHGIRRQPVSSAIKVLSLSVGLLCSTLVYMHVSYVESFDKHISNWDHTYRLVTYLHDQETNTPFRIGMTSDAYAPQLLLDYPQIESLARIRPGSGMFSTNNEASENSFFWAEPDIISIFDLKFVQGDPLTALNRPGMVVITESTANKYFGDDDPLGKTLTLDDEVDLRVSGVIRELPRNSHIRPEMLIASRTGNQVYGPDFMGGNAWLMFAGTFTYLTLKDGSAEDQLSADFPSFIERNLPDQQQRGFADQMNLNLGLQPISEIYLDPLDGVGPENEASTQRTVLKGLILFSILIMLTSCINYITLAQAQIGQRAKEIGVRRSLGAKNVDIFCQFLFESMVLTGIAALIAIPLVAVLLPAYTSLTSTEFTFSDVLQTSFVLTIFLGAIGIGLLAGFYPALSLSRLQVANIVRGSYAQGKIGRMTKSGVTVTQFALSVSLTLFAIAIYFQVEHLKNLDPGFNKNGLVVLNTGYNPGGSESSQYSAFRNELVDHPAITSASSTGFGPPSTGGYNPWRLPSYAPDENVAFSNIVVDEYYLETYQMKLIAGRDFSSDFPSDFIALNDDYGSDGHNYGVILTESAVRRLGFESPRAAVGQSIQLIEEFGDINHKVIGVIEDIRFSGGIESDGRSVGVIRATQALLPFLSVRIDQSRLNEALAHIDATWGGHRQGTPINRIFFSQIFQNAIAERTDGISKATLFSSIITGIIAAFGLFALASSSSLRRIKEVGVRKVLGANTKSIVFLFTWDFIKPVLLACAMSWPIAYYFSLDFYSRFSSQTNFPIASLIAVTAAVIVLSVITITGRCMQAANSDPVKSLRSE